jgi:hypothetical protein
MNETLIAIHLASVVGVLLCCWSEIRSYRRLATEWQRSAEDALALAQRALRMP